MILKIIPILAYGQLNSKKKNKPHTEKINHPQSSTFFINQISNLLNKLEAFIKENESSDVSYERSTKIHKSFLG